MGLILPKVSRRTLLKAGVGLFVPCAPAIIRPARAALTVNQLNGFGASQPAADAGPNIQFVGARGDGSSGATSGDDTVSITAGFPSWVLGTRSSLQENDLVIAVFATGSTADRTLSITDGTNPYTLIGSELYANDTFDTNLRVAYKFMGSTPDTSITFGPSGNAADGATYCWAVFSGVDPTTPLDVTVTTATGTNSAIANPPAITPLSEGSKIVVVGAAGHGAGASSFSNAALSGVISSSNTDTNRSVSAIGYYDGWTSGAYDPAAWTWSGTDSTQYSWAAMTIALRPA